MRSIVGWCRRPSGAAFPAWTVATGLSMIVAALGIQEVAHRVSDPLLLEGRATDADGNRGALELPERPHTEHSKEPAQRPEPVLTTVPDPTLPTNVASGPEPELSITVADLAAGWEIWAEDDATTRWARGEAGPDGQPKHHLEYLSPITGEWRRGYANEANTSLTSPWIDVPGDEGQLLVGVWSRMLVEPELDGLTIAWSDNGKRWIDAGFASGGADNDPVIRRTYPLGEQPTGRLRVRLTFTSDIGGSTWDEEVGNPATARGEWLEVHRVELIRLPVGAAAGLALGVPNRALEPRPADGPHVVMGISGESINPYHPEFRDDSPRAYAHPSTYIAGYPEDAIAVWLSFDAPDFVTAFERDRPVWEALTEHQLYWFPGTRVIGGVTPTDLQAAYFGCDPVCIGANPTCPSQGTTWCDLERTEDEAGDRIELIDWGVDATPFASAAAGRTTGMCPACLVVHLDATGTSSVRWASERADWIDLQVHHHHFDSLSDSTTTWDSECNSRSVECPYASSEIIHEVADRQLVVTNPDSWERTDPVHWQPIAGAPGAVTVSGHDHGHVSLIRNGSHVAANFCAVAAADSFSLALAERGIDYRMSTARAGGIYADTLLQARVILGDLGHGSRDGALALGSAGRVPRGPLADGRLTIEEWREVVEHTASPQPRPHPDGPRCHDGTSPNGHDDLGPRGHAPPTGTGLPWSTIPQGAPTWAAIGFGAIDEPAALSLARDVLLGTATLPDRSEMDHWLAEDHHLRLRAMQARRLLRPS